MILIIGVGGVFATEVGYNSIRTAQALHKTKKNYSRIFHKFQMILIWMMKILKKSKNY